MQPWFIEGVEDNAQMYASRNADIDVGRLDVTLLALFARWAAANQISDRLNDRGFDGVRFSDGLIFQHLVGADRTNGELVIRMEVTEQAASKAVADLHKRGWVELEVGPYDRRARRVGLSASGRAARRVLSTMITRHGGDVAVRSCRVLPPR